MMLYKMIENPAEGTLVQYLAVYVLRWRSEWGEPACAFVEDHTINAVLEQLEIACAVLEALAQTGNQKAIDALIRIDQIKMEAKNDIQSSSTDL